MTICCIKETPEYIEQVDKIICLNANNTYTTYYPVGSEKYIDKLCLNAVSSKEYAKNEEENKKIMKSIILIGLKNYKTVYIGFIERKNYKKFIEIKRILNIGG